MWSPAESFLQLHCRNVGFQLAINFVDVSECEADSSPSSNILEQSFYKSTEPIAYCNLTFVEESNLVKSVQDISY